MMALVMLFINGHAVLASVTAEAHEHSLERVSTLVSWDTSDMTNLMEAHAWLAVLAEARRSRSRMTQGTLTESTVVSGIISDSAYCGWLPQGGVQQPKQIYTGGNNLLERLRILPLKQQAVDHSVF